MPLREETSLNNQPVLVVTGLTSSIGRELGTMLVNDWRIFGISRNPPQVPDPYEWIVADLSVAGQGADQLVRRLARENMAQVQGFVHLAGVVFSDAAVATTGYEWDYTCAVNLRSAFELAVVLKPFLTTTASVVFVSSVDAALSSAAGPAAAYGASKAGLNGLVRHLAAEWGPDGIRVNSVMLGALQEGMSAQNPQVASELARRIALGRLGTARDAAQAIRFLLDSEASSYITGTALQVDGGLNIRY